MDGFGDTLHRGSGAMRVNSVEANGLAMLVGIATNGRPSILGEALADLAGQTVQPTAVMVTYGKPSDIADLPERFPSVHFIEAAGGSCAKRNRILDRAGTADLVLFIDDDFLLAPDYLEMMERAFRQDAGLVAATGRVLRDGAKGPGLSIEQGRQALARAPRPLLEQPCPTFNTYGCNMAFRMSAVRESGVRFDEKLPAYAWYEDIDFSRRLARHGTLLLIPAAMGVHLGVKVGRQSGRRLGYSQMANPAYLWRKGTFPLGHALRSMGRHLAMNLFRSFAPEPFVDRRGRLKGNVQALGDLLRGRIHPERILDMP